MQIKSVVRYVNGNIWIMHDISVFSLIDVIGGSDGRSDIFLGFDHDGLMRYFNFTKLLNSQPVAYENVTSWDKVEEYFNTLNTRVLEAIETNILLPSTYLTQKDGKLVSIINPYASTSNKHLRIFSGDNDPNIMMEYGSVNFPSITNNEALQHLLEDVVVSTDYGEGKLNLKNTLPVINGVVCYPEFTSDGSVLYARRGTRYVKSDTKFATNTVLIDVTDLGDLECIKLSKCQEVSVSSGSATMVETDEIHHGNLLDPNDNGDYVGLYRNTSVRNRETANIAFDLPENTDGYPVLVLFGRIITPLEGKVKYTKINDRIRVSCSIPINILNNILVSNLNKEGKRIPGTGFYRSYLSNNLSNIFKDTESHRHGSVYEDAESEALADLLDDTISFVALIKTDKKVTMTVREQTFKCNNKALWFASEFPVGGILINPKTLEIIDYTKIQYLNGSLVTFAEQDVLFNIASDNYTDSYSDAFMVDKEPIGIKLDIFKNIRNVKDLVLIDISYPGDEEAILPPVIPDDPQKPTGSYVEDMVDPIIPGETRLVVGSKANIIITSISRNTLQISGTEDLDGTYERTNVFSKFNEAIWYCRTNGEVFQLYCEDNFWKLGKVNETPKYQSSDNNGVIMPWNVSHIKWFHLEVEVVETSGSGVVDMSKLSIGYVNDTKIYVTANYPGLTGAYLLDDNGGMFNERTWILNDNRITYYGSSWCLYKDDKLIFKSEEAMTSSSPWHHLTWNYLGE